MRICVFQSSYEDSDHPLAEIDSELSDPSPYTTQHTFEHRLIRKGSANKEIDVAVAEGFDFHISFMWGTHDDTVAGIDACWYLESLELPMVGVRSRILNRSKQEFYDEARRLGAPRVPGTKGFPLFVKPAKLYASMFIDEKSICHNQEEVEAALLALNKNLLPGRERRATRVVGNQKRPTNGELVNGQADRGVADDIVVQEFIDGEEYLVTVIQMHNTPVALKPCKIGFPNNPKTAINFLTHDLKFDPHLTVELLNEQSQADLCTRLRNTAVEAFLANSMWENCMGCDVDIRVPHEGEPVAIEVNPMPTAFMPPGNVFEDLPIKHTFPGGHRAIINIFIANYTLRQKPSDINRRISLVSDTYDGLAETYDTFIEQYTSFPAIVTEIVNSHRFAGSILDLGCGTGLFGRKLGYLPQKPEVESMDLCNGTNTSTSLLVGVDVSRGMVEKCRNEGSYDEVLIGSLQDILPGLSNHDHIVCLSVLHFMTAPELSLVLARSFQLAQVSLTVSIDEIPFNRIQDQPGCFMENFSRVDEVVAFSIPPGLGVGVPAAKACMGISVVRRSVTYHCSEIWEADGLRESLERVNNGLETKLL
ncbi:MAG: hypothetical protein LQ343_000856 [Gyalolechia ehrenbergii]|nr:MAG: hypothetical protein LQ343_000856 [Gyalolechia ehrenbergii]